MMAALPVIEVRYSPDLMAIFRYIAEMMERMAACNRVADPRLLAQINSLTISTITRQDRLWEIDLTDGQIVVSPSDDLLDYVAKFRALERAMK